MQSPHWLSCPILWGSQRCLGGGVPFLGGTSGLTDESLFSCTSSVWRRFTSAQGWKDSRESGASYLLQNHTSRKSEPVFTQPAKGNKICSWPPKFLLGPLGQRGGGRARLSSDALGPSFRTLLDMRTWLSNPLYAENHSGVSETPCSRLGRWREILLARKQSAKQQCSLESVFLAQVSAVCFQEDTPFSRVLNAHPPTSERPLISSITWTLLFRNGSGYWRGFGCATLY